MADLYKRQVSRSTYYTFYQSGIGGVGAVTIHAVAAAPTITKVTGFFKLGKTGDGGYALLITPTSGSLTAANAHTYYCSTTNLNYDRYVSGSPVNLFSIAFATVNTLRGGSITAQSDGTSYYLFFKDYVLPPGYFFSYYISGALGTTTIDYDFVIEELKQTEG